LEQIEKKEKLIRKNMDKQKNLYEIFSEDKLNIDIYKDKADLLRNEEKNLRREIKEIEMQILKNRNSINVVTETIMR